MNFSVPSPDQALAGLRAIKTVVTAARPLDSTRSALISASQKHVLQTNHDFDQLEPITPEALVEAIVEPRLRDQMGRALCLYVMIPDAPARAEVNLARRFVGALVAL